MRTNGKLARYDREADGFGKTFFDLCWGIARDKGITQKEFAIAAFGYDRAFYCIRDNEMPVTMANAYRMASFLGLKLRHLVDIALAEADEYVDAKLTEKDYEDRIAGKFSSIKQFKDYSYVARQYRLEDGDIVDIFAKGKTTGLPVIIELKMQDKSGHKQLRSYATELGDSILINISETPPKCQRNGIIYYTYNDLGMDYGWSEGKNRFPKSE